MKIRIKFSKQGNMRFIGHLDIMRYFQKAMRRADVDIRYSEGFSPHQIYVLCGSSGRRAHRKRRVPDIEVLSTESSGRMVERLNVQMAEGMEVLSFKRLPDSAGNAMSLVAACDYTVSLKKEYEEALGMSAQEFFDGLCGFIETGDLNIVKKTKKGEKQMDLRPYIYEHRPSEDGDSIFLRLSAGSAANVKPELLLEPSAGAVPGSSRSLAFPSTGRRSTRMPDLGTAMNS